MLPKQAQKYLDDRSREVMDNAYKKATIALLKSSLNNMSPSFAQATNEMNSGRHRKALDILGYSSYHEAYNNLSNMTYVPEFIMKGGQKDLGKLNAVKRTVIRNGKPVTITVYEDGKGDNGDPTENASTQSSIPRAQEMPAEYTTDHKKAKEAMDALAGSTVYGVKRTATLYLVVRDSEGEPMVVVGYKRFGHYLKLMFVNMNKEVEGGLQRAFFELAKLCLSKNLGLKVDKDVSKVLPYKAMYNMQEDYRGDVYLGYEDLKGVFGDG